ncbi:acyl-CoA dehydrogenase family protein [uncultured Sphingomonas sp.]|uniref:acyl-CoA dehydrogenase family protein n=1 Tax=uncultured Sphingomonas sp. TaxID=158754 RepID=UPI0035CB7661
MNVGSVASVATLVRQLGLSPGIERLRALAGMDALLDDDTMTAILAEADRFSADRLTPFDRDADRAGCTLRDGRVELAPGHGDVWAAYRDAGWGATDIPQSHGGQGLPAALAMPIQELFDRGSVSFGMAPGAARSAARLLLTHAATDIAGAWVPAFATGEAGATICISEPDAGSDVGRIRTAATRQGDAWRVTGEKIWISYGDHPLNDRIAHLVLARSDPATAGTRGLSLFLVPSTMEGDDGGERRNAVIVRRMEEKLGLHGSPTCALGFEDAAAILIGAEGRGVPQLFRMIVAMRLQVGTQGLGLASACLLAAAHYAEERRQGGPRDRPAVPIVAHADVQLMLIGMAARIATLRGIVYAAAVTADLADLDPDAQARAEAAALLGWLLPIVKNSGAETAYDIAGEAILLFGGAGYTTEWPIERHLRDARILAIYEGTTGMQALDLVRRRWLPRDAGYEAFVAAIAADLARLPDACAHPLRGLLDQLESATTWLRDTARGDIEIDAAARAGLKAATLVAHGWAGARLAGSDDAALVACGRHALSIATEQLPGAIVAMREGTARIEAFADMAT